MRCRHCHNEMNPQERFCSKCGSASFAEHVQPSFQPGTHDWEAHVKILAWILIVSSLFMVIPGFSLLRMMRMGMVHTPFHFAGPLFPAIAMAFLSIPAVNIIAGVGLLKYRDWARILTLILAAFMLIGFPFGTAIGIYAFWVLLSSEGSSSYIRYSSAFLVRR